MTTRYQSLQEFRGATMQAKQERDAFAKEISGHWSVLQNPATRGLLMRDALGDALRSWAPFKRVHDVFNGHISGSTVSAVGMAVASMQRGFFKRILFSGISMLLGKMIGDKPESGDEPNFLSTLATSIGNLLKQVRERRSEKNEEEDEEESAA